MQSRAVGHRGETSSSEVLGKELIHGVLAFLGLFNWVLGDIHKVILEALGRFSGFGGGTGEDNDVALIRERLTL